MDRTNRVGSILRLEMFHSNDVKRLNVDDEESKEMGMPVTNAAGDLIGGEIVKTCTRIMAVCLYLLILVVSAEAQSAGKTGVIGAPPFVLGTPMTAVLGANKTLQPSNDACSAVQTTNYTSGVVAPIGGYPYPAEVLLCFYQGNLGAIRLRWSPATFMDSPVVWRSGTRALADQLAKSYAPPLIKRSFLDDDIGGRVEIRDDQGNILTMVSNSTDDETLSITLWYFGASYDRALNGQPVPVGSY